jgi:CRP-like cAMP-binding protein
LPSVIVDESLDALPLSRLPTARHFISGPGDSAVFEIPLDDLEPDATDEQLKPEQLPPTPLFSSLDQATLRELIERVEVRNLAAGEEIYRQGQPGDSLFVLVEGRVGVYRDDVEIGRLDEGAFFGEIALLTKLARWATVRAISESCTLLEISRQLITELVKGRPQVLTVLLRFFRTRLIDGLVDTSPLFAPFSGPDRQELASRFGFVEADPGCDLLVAGEPASALYILLTGKAEVLSTEGAASVELGSGDLFGEAPLLTGVASEITVRTRTKCWLLKLDREVFLEVIMTHPQVLEIVSNLAAAREQQATSDPLRRTVTIA